MRGTTLLLNIPSNIYFYCNIQPSQPDHITGNDGYTTVVLQGTVSDYTIIYDEGKPILVTGLGRFRAIDGLNILRNVDTLQFLNKYFEQLKSSNQP